MDIPCLADTLPPPRATSAVVFFGARMSQTTEYIKHRLVCSPIGGVLDAARGMVKRVKGLKHPELKRLLREDAAIDTMFR